MPTLTNTQGAVVATCSPNDQIAITVNSGAFSLEYPIGTVIANGSTTTATYNLGAGQYRLTTTGSVTYTVSDYADSPIVGIPSLYYKQSGTTAAPIVTFDGATSSGVLGTAQPMLFPPNSIIPGISHARFRAQCGKTGASTGSLDVRIGTTNSTADTNLMSGVAPSWTATTPSEIYIEGVITFGAGGRAKMVATANVQSVGNNFRYGTEVTGLDFTVANYLTFVISGTSAGTSFPFVAYEVALFK